MIDVSLTKELMGSVESCEELSEHKMWSTPGPSVWKADRFTGFPMFYPVYKYENFYSYSLLCLILLKGCLRLNPTVAHSVSEPNFLYQSGTETLDLEIKRLGGVQMPGSAIKQSDDYAQRVADALRQDTGRIEAAHRGFTNIILCGGKDSLNLLLLPWQNPVIVASAPPNYELVKGFIANNGLKFDVEELDDTNDSLLDLEILINCCRSNLEHCRWGYHLTKLSRDFNGKVLFWKGQMADVFMTPTWKTYIPEHDRDRYQRIGRKFRRFESHFYDLLEKGTFIQRSFFKNVWHRGAMWQGAHMSIIRQLTNSLVLSGYHGPAMQKVLREVDLSSAVQRDVRPLIGKYLKGGPVVYPTSNPGPPASSIRQGVSHLEPFLKHLSLANVPVRDN